MSPSESAGRAIGWLEQQVAELTGIRNATARDPSFKNWRQNTLTVIQRIWPADQGRTERFRRIPFSPADARSDVRTQREWYSRGCQEAARVLSRLIDDVRAQGVPALAEDAPAGAPTDDFQDDFPTVDLPPDHPRAASPHEPAPPAEARPARKGLGVAAKLRDLLEMAGLSSRSSATPPRDAEQPPPAREKPEIPDAGELGIVPVGDEITPPAPPPPAVTPPAPAPAWPTPSMQAPPAISTAPTPPAGEGNSVTMSRPTTLRTSIEKVSIESLISKEFRAGAKSRETVSPQAPASAATPAAAPTPADPPPAAEAPAASAPMPPPPAPPEPSRPAGRAGAPRRAQRPGAPTPRGPEPSRPPLSLVPPLSADPEFNVDPAPPAGTQPASAEPVAADARERAADPAMTPPSVSAEGDADAGGPSATTPGAGRRSAPDSEELARATEDFLRSSPVLGATGRKVHRHHEDLGFQEPDAIAVAAMADDVGPLGVPAARHAETRARLMDLARRLEQGPIEWAVLRRAVWFAMEYPEVARRLMPVLLPWFDRAA